MTDQQLAAKLDKLGYTYKPQQPAKGKLEQKKRLAH